MEGVTTLCYMQKKKKGSVLLLHLLKKVMDGYLGRYSAIVSFKMSLLQDLKKKNSNMFHIKLIN